jgi:hypothetical protein
MTKSSSARYFCPLYGRDIAQGKCLDINYERLGYLSAGCLDEVAAITGKQEPEITKTCTACPNLPFGDELGAVILPSLPKDSSPSHPNHQRTPEQPAGVPPI